MIYLIVRILNFLTVLSRFCFVLFGERASKFDDLLILQEAKKGPSTFKTSRACLPFPLVGQQSQLILQKLR